MSITLSQYKEFLANPTNIKNIICTVGCKGEGIETVLKLSLRKYLNYLPVLENGVIYSEQLSLTDQPSISVSGLKFNNHDGKFDYVLKYIFKNRPVTFSIGDISWPESNYYPFATCIASHIVPDSEDSFTLVLGDKLQKLNVPISEYTIKDYGINSTQNDSLDTLVPILIGECANITPILFNKLTRSYRYSIAASQGLIELREDEIPVSLESESTSSSSFIPKYRVEGELTCSAKGHLIGGTTYTNRIGAIIAAIAKEGGTSTSKFLSSEIDWAKINSFDLTFPYPIGYYSTSKENMLAVMQAIASSVQAQIFCSRDGKLSIDYLRFSTPVAELSDKYLLEKLKHVEYIEPVGAISLNYCKNWTVQNVKNQVVESSKSLLSKEWQVVTKTNSTVLTDYRLPTTNTPKDTYLIRKTDAETECQRQLDFWSVPRNIYEAKISSALLWITIGATLTLKFNRYGLNSVPGIIIGMDTDITNFSATIRILV